MKVRNIAMRETLILLFILLITLGLFGSYIFLAREIAVGTQQLAEGQSQLAAGESRLAKGKTKLAEGERKYSRIKSVYGIFKAVPFVGIARHLPGTREVFRPVDSKLAAGGQMIAAGRNKVTAGEQKIEAGKVALSLGEEKLKLANKIRIACGIGAIFFLVLLVSLYYRWRSSVVNYIGIKKTRCKKK